MSRARRSGAAVDPFGGGAGAEPRREDLASALRSLEGQADELADAVVDAIDARALRLVFGRLTCSLTRARLALVSERGEGALDALVDAQSEVERLEGLVADLGTQRAPCLPR